MHTIEEIQALAGISTRQSNGLSISDGNAKMGNIPSVSVIPVRTCPKDCPCRGSCYAIKECIYKSVKSAYEDNTTLISESSEMDIVTSITQYLDRHKSRREYFRFNVSGDVWTEKYISIVFRTAKCNPNTKFLLFTKQYDLVDGYCKKNAIPKNLAIYMSVWGDYAPSFDYSNYHVAYYQNVKKGIIVKDESAFECPGSCTNCKHCFNGKSNVIFNHH